MKIFSWKRYKEEIENFGYVFSVKKIVLLIILFSIMVIGTGVLYRLKSIYILAICLVCIVCVPIIYKKNIKKKYEAKRFEDVCAYIEQMCSSFAKQPKILAALNDTSKVMNGKFKKLIDEAVEYIQLGVTQTDSLNIYEEALKKIEKEYECRRLKELHKFFIKVEVEGGDYDESLNILLREIHAWIERTCMFQKERKDVCIYFAIGSVISLVSCATSLLMTEYVDITDNVIYNVISALFIIACVVSYTLIEGLLTGSWLERMHDDELIISEYRTVTNSSPGKIRKRMLAVYIVLGIPVGVLAIFKMYLYCAGLAVVLLLLLGFPSVRYGSAKKRIIQEVKYAFSEWLMEISINLQYQTVQMSIQNSYENASPVLKNPIKKLISEIADNPSGIEPYSEFLSELNIREVSSGMKMLYSLTEISGKGNEKTLEALVERNYKLIDQAERMSNANKMSFIRQVVSGPLIFACVKIMADMLLIVTGFLSQMNNIQEFIN